MRLQFCYTGFRPQPNKNDITVLEFDSNFYKAAKGRGCRTRTREVSYRLRHESSLHRVKQYVG